MNAPIGNQLDNELSGTDQTPPEQGPRPRSHLRIPINSDTTKNYDFMGDLLDAQQVFITAQYTYLQDSNTPNLLRAQRDLIWRQTQVLDRLGVFG